MKESRTPAKSQELPQEVPCFQGAEVDGQCHAHKDPGKEKTREVGGDEGKVEESGVRVQVPRQPPPPDHRHQGKAEYPPPEIPLARVHGGSIALRT